MTGAWDGPAPCNQGEVRQAACAVLPPHPSVKRTTSQATGLRIAVRVRSGRTALAGVLRSPSRSGSRRSRPFPTDGAPAGHLRVSLRVLCGFGQQHPLRAPQRVQRIALEIVSSGVSMSSRCLWASSCGSIMTLCPQTSQCSHARLRSLASIARWARFQSRLWGRDASSCRQ